MKSSTKEASREAHGGLQRKVRLAFVGVLLAVLAGLCLVTLSGCSILPAHALGGSDAKDFQAEQSVQAVGGNSSGLSQTYQEGCRNYCDANNDGICDNCDGAHRGVCQKCGDPGNGGLCDNCDGIHQRVCQKCGDTNNDGICDNCGNAYQDANRCVSCFVDTNNNGLCDHRENACAKHHAKKGAGASKAGAC